MAIGLNRGIGLPGGGSGATGAHMTGIRFDKKVATGNQYKVLMSDGTEYTFVVPEGKGIDLSGLRDGSVPVYDTLSGKLVDSGVLAGDGDITIEPNSLHFGVHKMSSSPANVVFENTSTGKYYAPLWQDLVPGVSKAYIRTLGRARDIVRSGGMGTEMQNPDFQVPVKKDETVFSVEIKLSRPAKGIQVEVFASDGKIAGRMQWFKAYPAGDTVLKLDPPWDFKADLAYTVKVRDTSGDIIYLLGNGVLPYWTVNRAVWDEEEIAKKSYVDAQLLRKADAVALVGISGDISRLQTQIRGVHDDQNGKLHTMDEIVAGLKALGYLKPETPVPDHGSTSSIRAYVFFSSDAVVPATIPSSAQTHSGDTFTVSKDTDEAEYVYVVMPLPDGDKVTRVAEQGGIPTAWSKGRRVLGGVTYDVLRSPSPYVERSATFVLYP